MSSWKLACPHPQPTKPVVVSTSKGSTQRLPLAHQQAILQSEALAQHNMRRNVLLVLIGLVVIILLGIMYLHNKYKCTSNGDCSGLCPSNNPNCRGICSASGYCQTTNVQCNAQQNMVWCSAVGQCIDSTRYNCTNPLTPKSPTPLPSPPTAPTTFSPTTSPSTSPTLSPLPSSSSIISTPFSQQQPNIPVPCPSNFNPQISRDSLPFYKQGNGPNIADNGLVESLILPSKPILSIQSNIYPSGTETLLSEVKSKQYYPL